MNFAKKWFMPTCLLASGLSKTVACEDFLSPERWQVRAAKFLSLLLVILMPAAAPAQFTSVTQGSMVTITGYNDSSPTVVIPSTIGGFPVTAIGTQAFYNDGIITSVTIPNSVNTIQDNAFNGCNNLTTITFMGSGLTTVGNYAFANLYNLWGFTLSGTVNNVGQGAWANDYSMTYYNIQNGATTIGSNGLINCSGLSSLNFPASVVGLPPGSLQGCYGLSNITVDAANPSFASMNGVLFNKNLTTLIQFPPFDLAASYTIPGGVTSLAIGAFEGNLVLTNLTISDTVTDIQPYAFYSAGLPNLDLPPYLINLGDWAFADSSITRIRIPRTLTSIGNDEFFNCASLSCVDIPCGVTSIGFGSFALDTGLLKIDIPGSVNSIGGLAFWQSGLTSAIIRNGVTSIGQQAFYQCPGLTYLSLPGSVNDLGYEAFGSCTGLTGVFFGGNVPSGITSAFDSGGPTFYYLPGTSNWTTIGGFQTELWNAKIKNDSSLGFHAGVFGFYIYGNNNLPVSVRASTSLIHARWRQISTLTLTGGSAYFSDPDTTPYSTRFYQVEFPFSF
jgi:hypothetical protein